MRYLRTFLFVLLFSYVLLMPAWISWVPRVSWSLATKRVVMVTMVMISTVFAVAVILKPTAVRAPGIAADLLIILYLLIVFGTAYHNWSR